MSWVAYTCDLSYMSGGGKGNLGKSTRSYMKNKLKLKGNGALGSVFSTKKQTNKQKRETGVLDPRPKLLRFPMPDLVTHS
jgi:hypothetical protein